VRALRTDAGLTDIEIGETPRVHDRDGSAITRARARLAVRLGDPNASPWTMGTLRTIRGPIGVR
jgi:hypothetical protein